MQDVKDLLINTIRKQFDCPIFLQGSLDNSDRYPDDFFTFWNNETVDASFYDNEEKSTIWDFDLNYYSISPTRANEVLLTCKRLLKNEGFIVSGAGYDVMSDEPTHTGRGINVMFVDRY